MENNYADRYQIALKQDEITIRKEKKRVTPKTWFQKIPHRSPTPHRTITIS